MLNIKINETKVNNKYIVVVGSTNTDMVVRSSHLPKAGETVLGGEFMMLPGGKGANQAVTIARLGGNVHFITKLGNDIFGAQSKLNLEKEGVLVDYVFCDDVHPSGVALISVDDNGENSIVVAPGANAQLGIDEVNKAKSCILAAEIILMQLEIPITTVESVKHMALNMNKKVILNPAPACHLPDAVLNGLYLITPNHNEVEILTGFTISDEHSCEKASQYLKNKGVQNVIITLGSKGAYLSSEAFSGMINTIEFNVVDTTGAGDAFNGSIAFALSQEMNLESAVRYANLVAGLSVTKIGAQASVPYPSELEMELKNVKSF
ncbi:MAG: ribokinase [Saprospiraceae bacterium]|nr:ribokinase [Saprospiraceae bacterium]